MSDSRITKKQKRTGPSASASSSIPPPPPPHPSSQPSSPPSSPRDEGAVPTNGRPQRGYFTRKCKLSTILKDEFRSYKQLFREVAEKYSSIRRDTFDLGMFLTLIQFTNEQIRLQELTANSAATLREIVVNINVYNLHLENYIDSLNGVLVAFPQRDLDQIARAARQLVEREAALIRLQVLELDNIVTIINEVEQIDITIDIADPNILMIGLRLKRALNFINGRVMHTLELIDVFQGAYEAYLLNTQQRMNLMLPLFEQRERNVINAMTEHRNTEQTLYSLQRRCLAGLAVDPNSVEHMQTRAMLEGMINSTTERREAYLMTNAQELQDANLNAWLEMDLITRRLRTCIDIKQAVEAQCRNMRQLLDRIVQTFTFTNNGLKITHETFWSHLFVRVCDDPLNLSERLHFEAIIEENIERFIQIRRMNGHGDELSLLDDVQYGLSKSFPSNAIQNVGMHLLSFKLWIIRVFSAFLNHHQAQLNVRIAVKTMAGMAATGIVGHQPFANINITTVVPGFEELYDRIAIMYEDDFRAKDYDDVNDYTKAIENPLGYLRLGFRLLQECSSHEEWMPKTWSLLPAASFSIVHARFTGPQIMYGLFQMAHEKNLNEEGEYHIPPELVFNEHRLIYKHEFTHLYGHFPFREGLWESMFDFSKIQNNRVLGQRDASTLGADDPHQVRFAFSINTDGHMISILFEQVKSDWVPLDRRSVQLQRRNKDLTGKNKCLYPLKKNPTGITLDDRIIGIDPGVRDIICAVDCSEDLLRNAQDIQNHSFKISNKSYKDRSGMEWQRKYELQSREKSNIEESYTRIQTRKVHTIPEFEIYVNSRSLENQRIQDFMKSYKHRENKGYMFSNRRMANEHSASVVLGYSDSNESYKLAMDSSSQSRKRGRREYRRINRHNLRHLNNADDQRRTVVAYGDASLGGTFKGHTPIPVKKIQRAIAQKALVIPVDEYNTSQKCCHCLEQTRNINYSEISYMRQPRLECVHRKVKHKYRDERRKHLKCVDDNGNILWNTSDCFEREQRAFQNVYSLKLCQNCQREESPCIWNRDVNAACNIRTVMTRYIRSGFDLNSRQEQLTRGRRDNFEER